MNTQATRLKELWNLSATKYNDHVKKYFTHRRITNLIAAGLDLSPNIIVDFGCGP